MAADIVQPARMITKNITIEPTMKSRESPNGFISKPHIAFPLRTSGCHNCTIFERRETFNKARRLTRRLWLRKAFLYDVVRTSARHLAWLGWHDPDCPVGRDLDRAIRRGLAGATDVGFREAGGAEAHVRCSSGLPSASAAMRFHDSSWGAPPIAFFSAGVRLPQNPPRTAIPRSAHSWPCCSSDGPACRSQAMV